MKKARRLALLIMYGSLMGCRWLGGDQGDSVNTSPARGLDISHYQGDEIAFLNSKQDSLTFVICKATEGITIIDSDFSRNWTLIKQEGFIRGAYHFYHCQDDTLLQARHFLSTLSSLEKTDISPIIDFEESSVIGCEEAGVQIHLLAFAQMVRRMSGRVPIIYVDPDMASRYITDTAFAAFPLYIADHTRGKSPLLPAVWSKGSWAIWQKTDSLRLDNSLNDLDIFNGSRKQLEEFIQSH